MNVIYRSMRLGSKSKTACGYLVEVDMELQKWDFWQKCNILKCLKLPFKCQ